MSLVKTAEMCRPCDHCGEKGKCVLSHISTAEQIKRERDGACGDAQQSEAKERVVYLQRALVDGKWVWVTC